MEQLILSAKSVLANTFFMYYKAHSYHWNVEGIHFSQYHDFFSELYTELFASIDLIAEEIRTLDSYAPHSLSNLYQYKTISEDDVPPVLLKDMLANLVDANDKVLVSLNNLFKAASENNNQGLADFAATRIDVHNKHGWMLKSSGKGL